MSATSVYRTFIIFSRTFSSVKSLCLDTKHVYNARLTISRHESSDTDEKLSLKQRYEIAKAKPRTEDVLPSKVDPSGVFTNNELNLANIQVYGFDYDYTLAVYKETLDYLIYDLGRDYLVKKFKYPSEILTLKYKPGFAIRGLHYDMHMGLLMKIDSFHQIQFGSVYRGKTPLSKEEVIKIYGGAYIPQEMIRGSSTESTRMKQLNDLFSVPEIYLISSVTEHFEKNGIAYHPEILSYDIQKAVQSIHPVMHDMLDDKEIGKYLEKHSDMPKFLHRLKELKKKMFLITNSPFKFVDTGMRYMIGPNWMDLFDVVVVQARKPKFFTDKHRPFRIYDVPSKCHSWEKVTELKKGCIYFEGNLKELQNLTGWYGGSVLYFGDQIYSDLADLTLHHGWRTGAIIHELKDEDKHGEFTQLLLKERDDFRTAAKKLCNEHFGSIFRTHDNPTYFSRRLFRYSDIYMSHITNLLHYSENHIFYPRRALLPHESIMPKTIPW